MRWATVAANGSMGVGPSGRLHEQTDPRILGAAEPGVAHGADRARCTREQRRQMPAKAAVWLSPMNVIRTSIPDVLILEPNVLGDERGVFYESYNRRTFAEIIGLDVSFVQDNHTHSVKNALRGLHYQIQQPQGKLVRVVAGEVFDVAVDIRRSSPAFGKWTGSLLSAENRRMVWIPPGFAHGFVVTADFADLVYKATSYWAPDYERCIAWDDSDIAIDWPLKSEPVLSAKDQLGKPLKAAEVFD